MTEHDPKVDELRAQLAAAVSEVADLSRKLGLRDAEVEALRSRALAAEAELRRLREPGATPDLYYIQNSGCCGNSARWWRVGGHGYTSNLNEAWRVPKAEAEGICRARPKEDFPRSCSAMDAIAERHVDVQRLESADERATSALKGEA